MNIDKLSQSIRNISNEPLIHELAQYIDEWKKTEKNVKELEVMVERFFGNSWIPNEKEHSRAYSLWNSFKEEAINKIGGMTMNERLYLFCLFDCFDSCCTDEERLIIYDKVHAKP